jgi:hypothetical protein
MAMFILCAMVLSALALACFDPVASHMRFLLPYLGLPGLGLLLLAAAAGLQALFELAPRWRAVLMLAILGVLLGALALRLQAQDRRQDFGAYDFGRNLCLSLPPGALYLPRSDFFYMPLHYAQGVEQRRQDAVTVQTGLLKSPSGWADLALRCPGLKPSASPSTQGLLMANLGRPGLCIGPEDFAQAAWPSGLGFLQARGLVLEVTRRPAMARDLGPAFVLRQGSIDRAGFEPPLAAMLQWQLWAQRAGKALGK